MMLETSCRFFCVGTDDRTNTSAVHVWARPTACVMSCAASRNRYTMKLCVTLNEPLLKSSRSLVGLVNCLGHIRRFLRPNPCTILGVAGAAVDHVHPRRAAMVFRETSIDLQGMRFARLPYYTVGIGGFVSSSYWRW